MAHATSTHQDRRHPGTRLGDSRSRCAPCSTPGSTSSGSTPLTAPRSSGPAGSSDLQGGPAGARPERRASWSTCRDPGSGSAPCPPRSSSLSRDSWSSSPRKTSPSEGEIPTTYQELAGDVRPGTRILLDDGLLSVRGHRGPGRPGRRQGAATAALLKSNKGMNLPGVEVSAPAVTDKDREEALRAVAARRRLHRHDLRPPGRGPRGDAAASCPSRSS